MRLILAAVCCIAGGATVAFVLSSEQQIAERRASERVFDQRAREARLRLERAERLFAPRPAVTYARPRWLISSWPRWLISTLNVRIYGGAPRKSRTRKPLSDQRPSCTRVLHENGGCFSTA